jgi:hypothetical protein
MKISSTLVNLFSMSAPEISLFMFSVLSIFSYQQHFSNSRHSAARGGLFRCYLEMTFIFIIASLFSSLKLLHESGILKETEISDITSRLFVSSLTIVVLVWDGKSKSEEQTLASLLNICEIIFCLECSKVAASVKRSLNQQQVDFQFFISTSVVQRAHDKWNIRPHVSVCFYNIFFLIYLNCPLLLVLLIRQAKL